MKIKQLLKLENGSFPCWVQGHHTRLLLSENLRKETFFEVISLHKKSLVKYYEGHSEKKAVEAFLKSESTHRT